MLNLSFCVSNQVDSFSSSSFLIEGGHSLLPLFLERGNVSRLKGSGRGGEEEKEIPFVEERKTRRQRIPSLRSRNASGLSKGKNFFASFLCKKMRCGKTWRCCAKKKCLKLIIPIPKAKVISSLPHFFATFFSGIRVLEKRKGYSCGKTDSFLLFKERFLHPPSSP